MRTSIGAVKKTQEKEICRASIKEIYRTTIGPFKAGKYKSQKLEDYLDIRVHESSENVDVMKILGDNRQKLKAGMTVEAKYMLGRYKGQWYECVLVEKVKGEWTVAWCDGTKKDMRKTLEHIRIKRG